MSYDMLDLDCCGDVVKAKGTYWNSFDRFRLSLIFSPSQGIQTVSFVPLKVELDIEVRITVLVVHTSALLRNSLYSMFAFRSCLIVRLPGYLTFHNTFDIFGGFGLGVYVGWKNAMNFAGKFCGKL